MFAVTGGTSRDKQATASPKKFQSQPIVASYKTQYYDPAYVRSTVAAIRAQHGYVVTEAASVTGVSHKAIEAIMFVESRGNQYAVNRNNEAPCWGLMQLEEPTARRFGLWGDLLDARENTFAGARAFRYYLQVADGDFDRALAFYNKGPAKVARLIRNEGFDPSQDEFVLKVREVMREIG
jgi:soluble lytic murein transglycosylase-like protein